MMPLTSSWKKNAIRCEFCLSLGCAPWNVGRLPTCHCHHSGPRDGTLAGCRHAIAIIRVRVTACRQVAGMPSRRDIRSAGQPGISWYLPTELILKRKNLPWALSPCELKLMGCPRIEVDSFVFLIAASTFARLGVWPALQTEAMASSITWVAAKMGGPNVPKEPNFAFAVATSDASAGMAVMSGPKADT